MATIRSARPDKPDLVAQVLRYLRREGEPRGARDIERALGHVCAAALRRLHDSGAIRMVSLGRGHGGWEIAA